jgi:hypothetical protein
MTPWQLRAVVRGYPPLRYLTGQVRCRLAERRVQEQFDDYFVISDLSWGSSEHRDWFVPLTRDSLSLIRRYDRVRFRRLRQNIRYIVNEPLPGLTLYDPLNRHLGIDFARFPVYKADYEWSVAKYAAVLIDVATQGYLLRRGIVYSQAISRRYLHIGAVEQQRFALQLGQGKYNFAENLVPTEAYDFIADARTMPPYRMVAAYFRRLWGGRSRDGEYKG